MRGGWVTLLAVLVAADAAADEMTDSDDLAPPPPPLRKLGDHDPNGELLIKSARRAARSGDCVTVEQFRGRIAALHDDYYDQVVAADAEINNCTPPDPHLQGVMLNVEGALRLSHEGIATINESNLYGVGLGIALGLPRRRAYLELGLTVARQPTESGDPYVHSQIQAYSLELTLGSQLCFAPRLCASAGFRAELASLTERFEDRRNKYFEVVLAVPLRLRWGGTVGVAPYVVPEVGFAKRVDSTLGLGVGLELSIGADRQFGGRARDRSTRSGPL